MVATTLLAGIAIPLFVQLLCCNAKVKEFMKSLTVVERDDRLFAFTCIATYVLLILLNATYPLSDDDSLWMTDALHASLLLGVHFLFNECVTKHVVMFGLSTLTIWNQVTNWLPQIIDRQDLAFPGKTMTEVWFDGIVPNSKALFAYVTLIYFYILATTCTWKRTWLAFLISFIASTNVSIGASLLFALSVESAL